MLYVRLATLDTTTTTTTIRAYIYIKNKKHLMPLPYNEYPYE